MRQAISYADLKAMDLDNLYVRYSSGVEFALPKSHQMSTDHGSGQKHQGLSANNLRSEWVSLETQLTEYIFCLQGNNKAWVVEGQEIGRDTDNAPLIEVDRVLGYIPLEELQKAEQEDNNNCTHSGGYMNFGKGLECPKCGTKKRITNNEPI